MERLIEDYAVYLNSDEPALQDEVIAFEDLDDFSEGLRGHVKLLWEKFGKYEE